MGGAGFGATVVLILAIFGIVVGILWVLMPFAIFGSKDLLRELIREQRKTNELLAKLQASKDPEAGPHIF